MTFMTLKSETNRQQPSATIRGAAIQGAVIRAFAGALIGVSVVLGGAGAAFFGSVGTAYAAAEDDEDEAPDTKFFRGLLKGLGLRRDGDNNGIDYRERSPLVLPNGRNLPAPETEPVTAKNPAWPVDVDVKRAKDAKSKRAKENISAAGNEQDRPELPSQLGGANRGGTGAPTAPVPAGQAEEASRPSSAAALGTQGIFKSFWAPKEEYATFTGEPTRDKLTEPPVGYRTPSAAQPYGVGKEKWIAPKANTAERHNDVR